MQNSSAAGQLPDSNINYKINIIKYKYKLYISIIIPMLNTQTICFNTVGRLVIRIKVGGGDCSSLLRWFVKQVLNGT